MVGRDIDGIASEGSPKDIDGRANGGDEVVDDMKESVERLCSENQHRSL